MYSESSRDSLTGYEDRPKITLSSLHFLTRILQKASKSVNVRVLSADARDGDSVDVVGTLRGRWQRRGRVLGPLAGLRRPRPHAAESRGRRRSILPLPAGSYSVPGKYIMESDLNTLFS